MHVSACTCKYRYGLQNTKDATTDAEADMEPADSAVEVGTSSYWDITSISNHKKH